MGLDIRVYKDIKLTENREEADFVAYVIDSSWRHKIKNLQENKSYVGRLAHRGISYPYSAHSRFRESLVKLVDRMDLLDSRGQIRWDKLTPEVPFYDLINFADNEGCLDWEISASIYRDFEKFNEKAKSEMDELDYKRYKIWLETFKESKDNGVVVFS